MSCSRLQSAPRYHRAPFALDRRNQPPSWLPTTAIRTTGWRAWATHRLPCRPPPLPGCNPGESWACSRTASTESALRLPAPTYSTRPWDIKVRMSFLVCTNSCMWYSTDDSRSVQRLVGCLVIVETYVSPLVAYAATNRRNTTVLSQSRLCRTGAKVEVSGPKFTAQVQRLVELIGRNVVDTAKDSADQ